jgi:hypothetical protein
MKNDKYTFVQFLAAIESDDFDNIDKVWLDWANKFVEHFPEIMKTEQHGGDCTKMPGSCPVCSYESLLAEYRIYYFDEERWRKEYM